MKVHRFSFVNVIAFVLVGVFIILQAGCSNNGRFDNIESSIPSISIADTKDYGASNSVLEDKAISVLDELSEDERVVDFRKAYDFLMDLPDNKDDFIDQLDKANRIFEKYDVDFKYGSWYLQPYLSDESITKEGMDKYKEKSAYWDAENLLEAIVYPVLFDKYGGDAQHIEGIVASDVIAAIESTCDYMFEDKVEQYNGCTETWEYIGTPESDYEIKYQSNGLVESVNIPIVRSNVPMDDAAFSDFFNYNLIEQKQFAGDRFTSMIAQMSTLLTGYEVLSKIYTDEEISVICNYIKSLSINDIWEQNLWTYSEGEEDSEPNNYSSAVVSFKYKGNSVSIHYGLNSVYLRVIGGNYINQLSCRWYTLYCGLVLPDGNDDTIATYQNYIDFNIAANDVITDWSFDLDANADKYITEVDVAQPNSVFKETIVSDANIEIINVYPCANGIGDLTVDYRINNIKNINGCVYLKCDAHAFTTQMFFNDENHVNEYREDGEYSYEISWLNDGMTKSLSIRYGYGEFDSNNGWTNSCSTKIYYRLTEDYGIITSDTIPKSEIYDIYDGETYIGAWTYHQSGDLLEIDGESTEMPFSRNSVFCSENGNMISVNYADEKCCFNVNGSILGYDEGWKSNDVIYYEVDTEDGTYIITRYPKDEYITVEVTGFLDTSLEGQYFP